jgi:hypothetical protein
MPSRGRERHYKRDFVSWQRNHRTHGACCGARKSAWNLQACPQTSIRGPFVLKPTRAFMSGKSRFMTSAMHRRSEVAKRPSRQRYKRAPTKKRPGHRREDLRSWCAITSRGRVECRWTVAIRRSLPLLTRNRFPTVIEPSQDAMHLAICSVWKRKSASWTSRYRPCRAI